MPPEQKAAAEFVIEHPRCALWMLPGLGKTLAVLAAIEFLKLDLILVVAPLRVNLYVWPDELAKWKPGGVGTSINIIGTPKKRAQIIDDTDTGYLTINYELLEWLLEVRPSLFQRVDMLVFDESSKLKSHKAKKYKALKKRIFGVKRVVELTGTPAPNGLMNIYSQLFLLDRGEQLGRFITHYRKKYFEADFLGFTWTPRSPEMVDAIHEACRPLVYSLNNTEYRDMVTQIPIYTRALTSAYRAMKSDGLVTLSVGGEDLDVVAESKAQVGNKLRQLANGFIYDEDSIGHDIHGSKIDALKDLVDEMAGQPIIVFYEFVHDKDRILKALPRAQLFSDKTIRPWNKGKIEVMVMSPWSAGHGLNLQGGGNRVCWFNPPFDLEIHEQANARVARKGQSGNEVLAYYLTGKNSIDERVMSVLKDKDAVQADLIAALEAEVN